TSGRRMRSTSSSRGRRKSIQLRTSVPRTTPQPIQRPSDDPRERRAEPRSCERSICSCWRSTTPERSEVAYRCAMEGGRRPSFRALKPPHDLSYECKIARDRARGPPAPRSAGPSPPGRPRNMSIEFPPQGGATLGSEPAFLPNPAPLSAELAALPAPAHLHE